MQISLVKLYISGWCAQAIVVLAIFTVSPLFFTGLANALSCSDKYGGNNPKYHHFRLKCLSSLFNTQIRPLAWHCFSFSPSARIILERVIPSDVFSSFLRSVYNDRLLWNFTVDYFYAYPYRVNCFYPP